MPMLVSLMGHHFGPNGIMIYCVLDGIHDLER